MSLIAKFSNHVDVICCINLGKPASWNLFIAEMYIFKRHFIHYYDKRILLAETGVSFIVLFVKITQCIVC